MLDHVTAAGLAENQRRIAGMRARASLVSSLGGVPRIAAPRPFVRRVVPLLAEVEIQPKRAA